MRGNEKEKDRDRQWGNEMEGMKGRKETYMHVRKEGR